MRPYNEHRGGRPALVDGMGLGELPLPEPKPCLLAANTFHYILFTPPPSGRGVWQCAQNHQL